MGISYGQLATQGTALHSGCTHPEVQALSKSWEKIRDADWGEDQVKSKVNYLPKSATQDRDDYAAYLSRAIWYNMTSKTIQALSGSLFKSKPQISGVPDSTLERFTKEGVSLHLTTKFAVTEILKTGRFGILVDKDSDGTGDAYAATYTAENILDWQTNANGGLTRLLLREIDFARDESNNLIHGFSSIYRLLTIDDGSYRVRVYKDAPTDGALPIIDVTPTIRGIALDHIPFQFIGAVNNAPNCDKPPILDIVNLNYSHYKSYADLENGRWFTANPIYTTTSASAADDDTGEYFIGSNMVWELGSGGEANILEFTGRGLTSLENSLTQKERQIESLGGRLMPNFDGAGRSTESINLEERSESTLLLNIADTMDEGFSIVLGWLSNWNSQSGNNISFTMNRDFISTRITARDLRITFQMYESGIIPLDAMHEYLVKADVIPKWMSLKQFKKLLKNKNQFVNAPDAIAHMHNYSNIEEFRAANTNTNQKAA